MLKIIIVSSLFLRVLLMALLCCLKLLYFSISVITSITLRLMGVSQSWMNLLGLIGAFLRNMLIFRRRIRNILC